MAFEIKAPPLLHLGNQDFKVFFGEPLFFDPEGVLLHFCVCLTCSPKSSGKDYTGALYMAFHNTGVILLKLC